jgi:hypothetical protein
MNPTRLPKEVLLPDWERRNMQGTKGDRVYHLPVKPSLCFTKYHALKEYEVIAV